MFSFANLLNTPAFAMLEKVAGIAGLLVIAYIIVSGIVSLFRPSPALEAVPVTEALEHNAGQALGETADRIGAKPKSGSGARSAVFEIVETIVMTLLIFAAVRLMVQNFRIEGNSMEPNLHNGQYLIIEKISYRLGSPQRGDVVVFHYPSNPKRDFIKRIIGLPGETIEIRRGQIMINGNPLNEAYLPNVGTYNWGPGVVGDDEYFVLGDNRNNSSDSHSWGMLPKELIIGKAWFTYWPISDWGVIPHYTFTDPLALRDSVTDVDGAERFVLNTRGTASFVHVFSGELNIRDQQLTQKERC